MNTADKVAFFQQIPLLQPLSADEMERLAGLARPATSGKFSFVYRPGEAVECIYFLRSGRVKIGTYAEDEREVIKDLLRANTVFGEGVLTGEKHHTEFAQVLSANAEYLAVRRADFTWLMHSNTRLLLSCLRHMNDRLQRIEDRLTQLLVKDARRRIIEFLLEVAGKEGLRVGYETLVRDFIPQQEIAHLTGTSRQTVTAVMNELRRLNLIHFSRGTILFRDVHRLASASEI